MTPGMLLGALLGLMLPRAIAWAAWRCLLWATARAERDPYFNREYARPRPGPAPGGV